jgi:ABC-type dipeptide/oligopeptide/nickel transport system permease subunit
MSADVVGTGTALPRRRRLARPAGLPASVALAAAVLVAMAVCAVAPGPLAPADPALINPLESLRGPSGGHVLGTDQLGRDVLARVIHGAGTALSGPLIIATATIAVSVVLSLLAGYAGGWVDAMVGRGVDLLYSLPPLIVAIVLVGVFGGGYWLAIVVLTVLNIPQNVRIMRAAVIERRGLPYVEAAEMLGVRPVRIMVGHLLPNIAPVVAACFFLRFTYGIVDLSSLSFLGLGVPPGSSDWGRMLAENRAHIFENAWTAIAPGVALVLTAVSANFVGDWLYEHFERRGRSR